MFFWSIDDALTMKLLLPPDARQLATVVRDNHAHLGAWLPWATASYSVTDAERFIAQNLEGLAQNKGFSVGLCHDDRLIGMVAVEHVDWEVGRASLGYWVAAANEGRGFVTRACNVLVRFLFEAWDLRRLEIHVAVDNDRSRAVAERLGFVLEATLEGAIWGRGRVTNREIWALIRN